MEFIYVVFHSGSRWNSIFALQPFSLSPGGTSCSSTKAGEGSDEGGRGGGRVGAASASGSPALIRLPAEFFHPVAAAALPAPPRARVGRPSRGLRLTSPASWSSLRSQGAHSRVLCTQVRPGLLYVLYVLYVTDTNTLHNVIPVGSNVRSRNVYKPQASL